MTKYLPSLLIVWLSFTFCNAQEKRIAQKVDSLIKIMTLEEKIGQLNQYSSDFEATGPITPDGEKQSQIRNGQLGSMLNVTGAQRTRELQEMAMESRLKIPLLFGLDVIHGYRTTFPIPLAEAASWDLEAIERSARIAAIETASAGVMWTFAPMVDISHDPRWGRVMEGAGEDPYLGSLIAKARVRGFQGESLGNTDAVMACAKHFAAYGAAIGGRDYNSVDISKRTLWNIYLPPFKAAKDAGVATFMNAFNDINGIPATGNSYLQRDILKDKWSFDGFVVSDWNSIGELVPHGFAKNNYEAAFKAITAGSDMDMESRAYKDHLARLVKEGKVEMALIDDAVRRILQKKFELGLFDDPFKFSNNEREKMQMDNPEHLTAAREMAAKSIVLLKNENDVLPISDEVKTIAFIGPLVKAVRDNLGFWSRQWPDDSTRIVTHWNGVKNRMPNGTKLLYARGCSVNDTSKAGFNEAIKIARQADLVLLSVGEEGGMSGEARSRSNIHLPGVQEDLIKAIHATGKPVVVMINAGRPLIFNWTSDNVPAILYNWWLGTEAGNAIADVLFGDHNPSGKLPMTFPRREGQIPVYYNKLNTGRPELTGYIDLPQSPAYPFGYGLSYTNFEYSNIKLSSKTFKKNDEIMAEITVTNTGQYAGTETIQLYIRDLVASVSRPVKELKDFQQIFLKPGESRTVNFEITEEDLKYYNEDLDYIAEPGEFKLFIGSNSLDVKETGFTME